MSALDGPEYSAWSIDLDDFPRDGSLADQLAFAVRLAILAPSSHNTQPWKFRITDSGIDVLVDYDRRLPVVDPNDRELFISCGAAAVTLRIALAGLGLQHTTEVLAADSSEVAARVTITGRAEPSESDKALLAAIPKRHTKRLPYDDLEVPAEVQQRLTECVGQENASLTLISKSADAATHQTIASLVMQGDRTQFADKEFRHELSGWIRNPKAGGDGLPPHATGQPDSLAPLTSWVIRTIDLGKSRAKSDGDLVDHSPLLAAIITDRANAADSFAAGQALGRLLLEATVHGVDASFINQPIEVPEFRPATIEALGCGDKFPQLLVRLGYGPAVEPSPRRPLADVLAY